MTLLLIAGLLAARAAAHPPPLAEAALANRRGCLVNSAWRHTRLEGFPKNFFVCWTDPSNQAGLVETLEFLSSPDTYNFEKGSYAGVFLGRESGIARYEGRFYLLINPLLPPLAAAQAVHDSAFPPAPQGAPKAPRAGPTPEQWDKAQDVIERVTSGELQASSLSTEELKRAVEGGLPGVAIRGRRVEGLEPFIEDMPEGVALLLSSLMAQFRVSAKDELLSGLRDAAEGHQVSRHRFEAHDCLSDPGRGTYDVFCWEEAGGEYRRERLAASDRDGVLRALTSCQSPVLWHILP